MTLKKKKILELFDEQSQRWVKAVVAQNDGDEPTIRMHEFIMAQIEVYSVIDDMLLNGAVIEKN